MKIKSLTIAFTAFFIVSGFAFSQTGSSLNKAKNENAEVDNSWNRLNPSKYKMQELDLPPTQYRNVPATEKKESSTLEKIRVKIQSILYIETQKHSEFYSTDNDSPSMGLPNITDSSVDENGNQVLTGVYNYTNNHYNKNSYYPVETKRNFIFEATVKQILDEYTVNKIIYKKGDLWYKLFPKEE